MKKRKPPIAKNLVKNSISGMYSAIEIHNKPTFSYRYEVVVLLILNSWELALKAYLYKFHKKIKLFNEDGTTKQFDNCLNSASQQLGKDFNPTVENLKILYGYRNKVAHFFIKELDPIIFALITKNIVFYSLFMKNQFKIDLSKQADLILLPIGFRKPVSPVDYISNESLLNNSTNEVVEFIKTIIDSTRKLNNENIDDTVFIDFKMNLTNINRLKNADIIAGIDNSKSNQLVISTKKEFENVIISKNSSSLTVSRNESETHGKAFYEELQDGIFDEINNIVDVNNILSKDKSKFILGDHLYFRIYSERQHVKYTIESFDLFTKTALIQSNNLPFLYWFTKLPPKNAIDILIEVCSDGKAQKMLNLIKIIILLGEEAITLFDDFFNFKFKGQSQKPNYFYTYSDMVKSKQSNPIFRCLKATDNKALCDKTYIDFFNDDRLAKKTLSNKCLLQFHGEKLNAAIRELDYISYGDLIINNKNLIAELKSRDIKSIIK
ncbi:hypothetical protein AM493_14120 [Flavobacterium akiainvivens]|uniref:DUF3644 domain-containing protein n=1 Tax=Flavobacterium akiainvivens TaxID=1202724 RepID=A0A0M9VIS9_9FLAO|nr:DUF3644 domain-containing protein [Flavobacterium akiainvivens]KOS07040.1 hypothetical protein AM493_14120 [Flavobacterium akiainvivens]SFQ58839.1 hypothetical protein SAMN05444144_10949 [Flavobacterium akiainvivens]